ncbi:huntingtin-interacting protein 1-related protein-like [Periophthalmus magnuspinnatus]|uniref:huntingtin-interacting protein 1-related protein-like n=1 Tax=Periophthalmus magnuspinnatus TaxID=409849 RepID=UPI00145ACF8C|nr:huntingtin-interacting protein 1-related protein-like [Periophthalmus magnuspinnatus]
MSKTKSKPEKEKTEKVLAAEKEQFNKQQLQSISKIVSTAEVPPKEKYVRNIILGTHKESGATTFWSYTSNVPLSSNSMVSWKFCYLLHKVLRDGHRNSVVDSSRHTRGVKDMGVLWGNLHDRYGHIVALYAKFLCLKIEFHNKYKMIPGNLEATDETLERQSGSDMTKVLDITNELLDYLDAALKMAETVFRQFDANAAKSTTASGQCRLTPLIPLILDCGFLYHFSVLLMFKLHSRIAPDILLGHRERYRDMFMSLKQFFSRARETEFFKTFIQIPELPDEPPNFLRAAALGEYKKQVVVTPGGDYPEDDEEQQPESRDMSQYYLLSQIGMPEAPIEEKETKIDPMKRELEAINPEVQLIKSEAQRCVVELKAKVNHLESELEEQRTHKQMAMVENEHLRMAVEALQSTNVANVGAQLGFKEADSRAQAAELRFAQLKERHAELVSSHADLLKKNAETAKVLSFTKQDYDNIKKTKEQLESEVENLRLEKGTMMSKQLAEVDNLNKELLEQRAEMALLRSTLENKEKEGSLVNSSLAALQAERDIMLRSMREKDAELSSLKLEAQRHQSTVDLERDRLLREIESLKAQLQQQLAINAEQKLEIERLKRELDSAQAQLSQANAALQSKEMSGNYLNSTLSGVQAEKEALLRSLREQESELTSLRQQAQAHQSLLQQERQRSSVEVSSLQAQLQQQACREGELSQKLQDEQFCLLQCAVVEAEGIILDALAKVDDPIHVRCISSPDYLINRAQTTLASIDKMQQSHLVYLGNRNDASGLLRAVTQFSHLAADTIVNGAATSHSAPTDHADHLTENCRECATHCLNFLRDLKSQSTLQRADPAAIRYTVQRLLDIGHALRPKGQDILQEELGTLVDKEMLATSTAIEEAVLRMDEILSQVKNDTTGIKLEVNQSILGSCSDLMKAVHMLVTAATDLQKDIVEEGRGATSIKEFYARNSRWTEGLISASKAVGWGATQLLESADRVVGENGTYEELIASSHEIAASTAQLVAASKVKSDRNNKKLHTLQMASRHVNDMAAVVVTSTKHGQKQISDTGVMDFSGMSLIKLKKEEMEAQVKVLQLENQLEQERVRLGELRKRHYDLGGADAEENEESFPPPPPPTLLDSTATSQPHLNTQSLAPTNPFTQTQTTSQSQPYTPATGFFSQSNTPPQTYSSMYSHAPSLTSSTAYTPTQPFVPSQPYVPPQHYTPDQLYTPSQMYTPAQPHSPKPQRHLQPSASQTAGQNSKESTRLKKPNIFTKSGNLLKNAFKKGESGTGESSGNHS